MFSSLFAFCRLGFLFWDSKSFVQTDEENFECLRLKLNFLIDELEKKNRFSPSLKAFISAWNLKWFVNDDMKKEKEKKVKEKEKIKWKRKVTQVVCEKVALDYYRQHVKCFCLKKYVRNLTAECHSRINHNFGSAIRSDLYIWYLLGI